MSTLRIPYLGVPNPEQEALFAAKARHVGYGGAWGRTHNRCYGLYDGGVSRVVAVERGKWEGGGRRGNHGRDGGDEEHRPDLRRMPA